MTSNFDIRDACIDNASTTQENGMGINFEPKMATVLTSDLRQVDVNVWDGLPDLPEYLRLCESVKNATNEAIKFLDEHPALLGLVESLR